MGNNKAIIETLNDLILINNDRILVYENALKEIKEDTENIKPLFLEMIDQSHNFKMQLATEIEVLGGDVASGTSVGGKIHQSWLSLKTTFSGHSEKSMLKECEFGEDAIKKAYDSALKEDHIPKYIRQILIEQLSELIEAHDEIKLLRDSA